jgi:hypothetical protein
MKLKLLVLVYAAMLNRKYLHRQISMGKARQIMILNSSKYVVLVPSENLHVMTSMARRNERHVVLTARKKFPKHQIMHKA